MNDCRIRSACQEHSALLDSKHYLFDSLVWYSQPARLSTRLCLQDLSRKLHPGLSKYQIMLITTSLLLLWWYSTRVKKESPNTMNLEKNNQGKAIAGVQGFLDIIKCRKSNPFENNFLCNLDRKQNILKLILVKLRQINATVFETKFMKSVLEYQKCPPC